MRKIFLSLIGLMTIGLLNAQVFTEDFENGGTIPTGWTQEYVSGTTDWIYQSGGYSGHPAAAYAGSYNALFFTPNHNNYKTKLVTPAIDLSSATDFRLTFYYASEIWNADQDTLKIYYKTSAGGTWTEIATYDVNQISWRKKTIPLPSPSSTYYIAFEGTGTYGYGICLDNVSITEIPRLSTVYTCDNDFYDLGGSSGNYSDNEDYIITYCSDNYNCIRAVIDYYEIEQDFDYLYIYDGTDVSGNLLQIFTGSSTNTNVTATLDDNGTAFYGLSGCLTFEFYSDGATNDMGWHMDIDCPANCLPPVCTGNDTASDNCENHTPICNLDGYCGNTSSGYTADHTELNYDSTGVFCGTIDNNSWLSFVADSTVALIDVWVRNCTGIPPLGRIHGIQIQIYDGDCNNFTPVSNCWSPDKEADGRIKATGLTPGNTYYIMIDGWGGDDCEYFFAASEESGIIVASAGHDQTICEGETATLVASGGSSVTWTSTPTDPSLSGQENNMTINVSPGQTTTYTATVSGFNPACPGIADVTVFVDAADATFTGLDPEYCENDPNATLTGNYATGVFSGTGISGNTFSPAVASVGTHNITYTFDYSVVTAFDDDFDPAPQSGWLVNGGTTSWVYGEPSGGDGDNLNSNSHPDPLLDHTSTNTDNIVLGQGLSDIDGDGLGGYYDNTDEWAMTPAIDCSTLSNTTLSFWRYANFEPNWDKSYVEVSNDGTNWYSLGEPLYPQDEEWTFRMINIAAYADGHSQVYIRWRSDNDGAQTYSGWNIDDVKITGVQSGGTCTSTDVQTTTVNEQPTANAGSDASICEGNTYTLNGTIGGGATSASWSSSGTGTFSNPSDLQAIYTPSANDITNGSITLMLTTNSNGACSAASNQMILTINPQDDASFSYASGTFCKTGTNPSPNYIATSGGTFSGSSGLIINSSTGEINLASTPVGTYTITYSTSGICPDTYSLNISITNGFDAEFSYNDPFCQNGTNPLPNFTTGSVGNFDATPSGLVFTSQSTGEIDLINSQPGTFTVTNTITASGGCSEATHQETITIYEAATVDAGSNQTICSDETINLHGTYGGSATQITWTTSGDGSFSNENDTLAIYVPGTSDINNGNVQLTLTTNTPSAYCGAVSDQILITIHPQPALLVSLTSPHCGLADGSITVSATNGTAPYSYSWSTSATTSQITGLASGVYSVTVSDNYSCSVDSAISLSDLNAGQIQLVSQNDVTCSGYQNGNITITMNGGSPGYSYEWSNGETTAVIGSLSGGLYNVTVTDASNCVVIGNFTINEPNDIQTIVYSTAPQCANDQTGTIAVNVTGGTIPYSYYWSSGETDSLLINLSGGDYVLTITDQNLCTHTDSIHLNAPTPLVISSETKDASCQENQDGSVSVSVTGGTLPYSFHWDNTTTDTSVIENLTAGNYGLTVTDGNNCSQTQSFTIYGSEETCLQIPNVFTPNNDGANDTWNIQGTQFFDQITVEVYNRWGDLIFRYDGSGTGYADTQNQWDGTYKEKKILSMQTFAYIIDIHNGDKPFTGNVTVVQ